MASLVAIVLYEVTAIISVRQMGFFFLKDFHECLVSSLSVHIGLLVLGVYRFGVAEISYRFVLSILFWFGHVFGCF